MERLTTDTPNGNFETSMNFVYGHDGWAYIRHDGEHENVLLTDWAKRQCKLRGCEEAFVETAEEIDQRLCDCMLDEPICPIAMAYYFASQAVHLRTRLKMYEDTGLEPEEIYRERFLIAARKDPEKLTRLRELVDADEAGRLAVLQKAPPKIGDIVYEIVENAILENLVTYVDLQRMSCEASSDEGGLVEFYLCEIGKTVFLTREEAEAALKKRERAGNETD